VHAADRRDLSEVALFRDRRNLLGEQSVGALQLVVPYKQLLNALGNLVDEGCLGHVGSGSALL
jgi:hypothetical protein